MRLDILTLFPEMFIPLKTSILQRAQNNSKLEINIINIRDFSNDKHKKCDDTPYGGGAGMVMTAQPIYDAVMSVKNLNSLVITTSPKGEKLTQNLAIKLAEKSHIIIICGHYEGIDERINQLVVDKEVSIGDYILTGGELAAMVIADTVSRLVPGVIQINSLTEESFTNNLLEYPQYTKPRVFMGLEVPKVLLSGNHSEIEKWRKQQSQIVTKKNRPDLIKRIIK